MEKRDIKILIVEDDVMLNKIYQTKLGLLGYSVYSSYDGDEGLKKADDLMPDLILLDLMLPKKNGFEVLSIIKSDPRTKMIPVIVLTNLNQEIERRRAMELGASEYLVKADTKIDTLVDKVRKYMAY